MTPEAQRIAIATACGLRLHTKQSLSGMLMRSEKPFIGCWSTPKPVYIGPLPDYCSDLNAMHEAEKVLSDSQSSAYVYQLTHDDRESEGGTFATAAQRAEAFLRTIGKWTDGTAPATGKGTR